MDVYYRDDFKKEYGDQLGDLYIHKESGEGYILIKVKELDGDKIEFPFVLQKLNGKDTWDSYTTFDAFIDNFYSGDSDDFERYSKEDYILELLKRE